MTIFTLLFALTTATTAGAKGEPVLLDFQASWCGPCKQMRGAIHELKDKNYPVKEIDVDESPDLAARYKVSEVPTFIVVDPAGRILARTTGVQPAVKLATLYREAKAKFRSRAATRAAADEDVEADSDEEDEQTETASAETPAAPRTNPKPWETGVRIRIDTSNGMMGFGSGTIIYSSAKESIILTCAHIFKLEGRRQLHPSQFNRKIMVDLFDDRPTRTSQGTLQVHFANETHEGKAIDYDFGLDVGLIVIKPGRRLAASPVVPPTWQPREGDRMHTVGCSEGHDATAWSTKIINPRMQGAITGQAGYEAIECFHAPKQGRSGGGLYTMEGYVAGVCDFAEPRGDHGLYASPRSIYKVLDRNNLTALYSPDSRSRGTLVADNGSKAKRRAAATTPRIERGQSPDREEVSEVTIPRPELVGVSMPNEDGESTTKLKSRRTAWQPHGKPAARRIDRDETPQAAGIKIAPNVGDSELGDDAASATNPEDDAAPVAEKVRPRNSNSKWRVVRPNPGVQTLRDAG